MIRFNPQKLTVDHLHVKSITTALGGSMRVVDEEHLEITGEEKLIKLPVPFAIARAFIKANKRSRFFTPVKTAVVRYDGITVALELFPYMVGNQNEGKPWVSHCETNIEETLRHLKDDNKGGWFIDGQTIFRLPHDLTEVVKYSTRLSADDKFRAYDIDAYSLSHLHLVGYYPRMGRHSLVYVADNGEIAVTPPVWKDLESIGVRQLGSRKIDETKELPFDKIDRFLSVNLNFALYAAKEISLIFGYEKVAPLPLPELMIKLKTINLPQVPKEVKATLDVGLPFTHAMAWIIGLSKDVNTITEHLKMRSILKYLTTKGIFHDKMFDEAHIYKSGVDPSALVMRTVEEAKAYQPGRVPGEYMDTLTGKKKDTIAGAFDE